MEAGINADQNFYRRPYPQSSSDGRARQPYGSSETSEYYESRPQPPPIVTVHTSNLQPPFSNGYGTEDYSPAPDDFYRSFLPSEGNRVSSTNGIMTAPSTMPASRQNPSATRSNLNGGLKPSTLLASRVGTKPTYRSASAPFDERVILSNAKSTSALRGSPKTQSPSVKDLLKRFDQNHAQPSIPPRRHPEGTPTPGKVPEQPSYPRSRTGIPTPPSSNASRPSPITRDVTNTATTPTSTRSGQRSRSSSENQQSNNNVSCVPRPSRTKQLVSTSSDAAKSMVNLSPTLSTKPAPPITHRKPLFGEVIPEQSGESVVAYGISDARSRRTSDPSLELPTWRQRSQSDADASPSSPTDWYRSAMPGNFPMDPPPSNIPQPPRLHTRANSDISDIKTSPAYRYTSSKRAALKSPPSDIRLTSASRLPVQSRRSRTSSDASSSQRSTSPKAKASTSRPWSPDSRAETPTKLRKPDPKPVNHAVRAKTPVLRSPRAPGHLDSSPGKPSINATLKAYISEPPPKLSPPLRSSRPRAPVSTASTAASRSKAAERSGSPEPSNRTQNSRTGSKITRPVIAGPTEFALARERIQRAYSNRIQENQAKELREAIARREKASREARSTETAVIDDDSVDHAMLSTVADVPEESIPEEQVARSPPKDVPRIMIPIPDVSYDESPILGMPGTFPDAVGDYAEEPRSAISGVTEFDNEAQTEPARSNTTHENETTKTGTDTNRIQVEESITDDSPILGRGHKLPIPIILDAKPIERIEESKQGGVAMDDRHENTYVDDLASQSLYGVPVFATTSSTTLDEPKIPPVIIETPRQPEEHPYQADATPVDDVSAELSTVHEAPPQAHAENTRRSPLRERSYASNSTITPSLPAIRTTLDERPTSPSSPIADTPVTEIDYDDSSSGTDENNKVDNGGSDLATTGQGAHSASRYSAWTDVTVGSNNYGSPWDYWDQPELPPIPGGLGSSAQVRERPLAQASDDDYDKPEVPPKPDNYSPALSTHSTFTPRPSNAHIENFISASPIEHEATGATLHDVAAIPPIPAWPDHSPPPPPQAPFSNMISEPVRPSPPVSYRSQYTGSTYYYPPERDSESAHQSVDDLSLNKQVSGTPTPDSSLPASLNDEPKSFGDSVAVPVPSGTGTQLTEPEKARMQKRWHIINEFITTEAAYLRDMNVVEEIYKGTAEACPCLEENDVKLIFRNTDELVTFTSKFFDDLKVSTASLGSSRSKKAGSSTASAVEEKAPAPVFNGDEVERDSRIRIGECFCRHLSEMQTIYSDHLKNSEQATSRITELQKTQSSVVTWLRECDSEARGLTAAWNLDALQIKPLQRITRYTLLLKEVLETTPPDHPDFACLQKAKDSVHNIVKHIDETKKRSEIMGKIRGRKRKDSDVRTGLAKAFGLQPRERSNRYPEDETYMKACERYNDEFIHLQIVLRDVEAYTREASSFTHGFLKYLSAMELVMRTSPSSYPEIESRWARFNMSMRDMGTVGLDKHVSGIRKQVIEPLEKLIKLYTPPQLFLQKRRKRRADYDKYLALKDSGKRIDAKLTEYVDEYETLNDQLKLELPILSANTRIIGQLCRDRYICLSVEWWDMWSRKVKTPIEESQLPKDVLDIISSFNRDYKYQQAHIMELGIINGTFLDDGSSKSRTSHSTTTDSPSVKSRHVPPPLQVRPRVRSSSSDHTPPSLPTPDFARRLSDGFSLSPLFTSGTSISPSRSREAPDYPTLNFPLNFSPLNNGHPGSTSPIITPPDYPPVPSLSRPHSTRPNTGRSHDSVAGTGIYPSRKSTESGHEQLPKSPSSSQYYSASQQQSDSSAPLSARPFSGIFHSAMPPDTPDAASARSSRASSPFRSHYPSPQHSQTPSRDRAPGGGKEANVLYLAASLFEFRFPAGSKSEAGYPYLTYQAGEIFDVIGEKGELWLARNQDDPVGMVGWIWSKHFARLPQ